MNTYSQKIEGIQFKGDLIIVQLSNGEISKPLNTVSQKLLDASSEDRSTYKISPSGYGIHWPKLDEDLSISTFLPS